jgi:hypothetical protein
MSNPLSDFIDTAIEDVTEVLNPSDSDDDEDEEDDE